MYLSHFGVISLDGSVTKPEPGHTFTNYQIALSHYLAALRLRKKLRENSDKAAARRKATNTDRTG